jgi:hypothetical protein
MLPTTLVICIAVCAAAFFAIDYQIPQMIWNGDVSMMTSLIGALFFVSSLHLGSLCWQLSSGYDRLNREESRVRLVRSRDMRSIGARWHDDWSDHAGQDAGVRDRRIAPAFDFTFDNRCRDFGVDHAAHHGV